MTYEEAVRQLLEENTKDIWATEEDGETPLSIDYIMENLNEVIDEEGQVLDMESWEVISFIQENYEEITGNDRSEMYAEQEFDYEVVEIAKACGVSYDTLCQEW